MVTPLLAVGMSFAKYLILSTRFCYPAKASSTVDHASRLGSLGSTTDDVLTRYPSIL